VLQSDKANDKEEQIINLSMGLQLKRKEMCGKNTVDGLHEDKC
jgi:hypothetical protein